MGERITGHKPKTGKPTPAAPPPAPAPRTKQEASGRQSEMIDNTPPRFMVELFAVFREGIYRHECAGIFSTRELAVACADAVAAQDRDTWHDYNVVPFILDQAPQLVERNSGTPLARVNIISPTIAEAEPVYSIKWKAPSA